MVTAALELVLQHLMGEQKRFRDYSEESHVCCSVMHETF